MVFFNYSTKLMAAKIVYYGPGLCGKTTNLQYIYNKTSPKARGEMVSLATETDRTLFFDLLPLDVGTIAGFKARFQLYTVPGQVFYNSTRRLVLKGVDAIVFVADSQKPMLDANIESFNNMLDNLQSHNMKIDNIPYVLQYNKRDLMNIFSIDELNKHLNNDNVPFFEAVAISGKGVIDTLKGISKVTIKHLRKKAQEQASTPTMKPTFGAGKKKPLTISKPPQKIEEPKKPEEIPKDKEEKKLSLKEKLDRLKQKRETAKQYDEKPAKEKEADLPLDNKADATEVPTDAEPTEEIKYSQVEDLIKAQKETEEIAKEKPEKEGIDVDKSLDDLKAMLMDDDKKTNEKEESPEDENDIDSLISSVYASVNTDKDPEITKETDKMLNDYLLSNVPDMIQEITIDKQFSVELEQDIYSRIQDATIELRFNNENNKTSKKSFNLQISKPHNTKPQKLILNLKFNIKGE